MAKVTKVEIVPSDQVPQKINEIESTKSINGFKCQPCKFHYDAQTGIIQVTEVAIMYQEIEN